MSRRPNIVFVITDDQGYGDLGCTGNPVLQTPHLDRMYEESARLTNFHVGPTCAPTRAGLMTGHYANSTGVWHTIGGRSLLRKNEWTLAAALRDNGYATGIFGKWHLGDAYPYRPQDRGFEVAVTHGGGGIGQTPDYWGNDYFDDCYSVNGEPRAFQGYCTDVFFSEALSFISANRDRPFMCCIPTNAPHGPYNVDTKYSSLYEGMVPEVRARFYGMISNIDENFGLLRDKLREWGLEEETILIFMTDNGTAGGARVDRQGFVRDGYNAGLRGIKNSPYDGGHRVPFFLRWPGGGLDEGKDIDTIAANVDFMPTILDLCGITVPEGRAFHGRSLKPLLFGETEDWPERTLVTDSQRVPQPVKWRQSAVMTDRWRLINGTELYDAQADREQREDVAEVYPEAVAKLREAYEEWWRLVSGQFEEDIPISIGAPGQGEACLNAHDWRNEDCSLPYHQGMIRSGLAANGYWEVLIEQKGVYRFELRRWPREAGHALAAGIDGDDVQWSRPFILASDHDRYTGGTALAIREGGLRIAGQERARQVTDGDAHLTLELELDAGPAHLETWLKDEEGQIYGAYYVYAALVRNGLGAG